MEAISKEAFLKSLKFDTKSRSRSNSFADITITLRQKKLPSGEYGDRINIYFRNDGRLAFGDYVKLAIYKNRIFIVDADKVEGWKISNSTNPSETPYGWTTIGGDVKAYKDFIGDYKLKYDDFYEIYYIEKKVGVNNGV